jgi:hypothetical protein
MATIEFHQHRGYKIELVRQGARWRVDAYPTQANLPVFRQSPLALKKEEAVSEAKRNIDYLLVSLEQSHLHCDH